MKKISIIQKIMWWVYYSHNVPSQQYYFRLCVTSVCAIELLLLYKTPKKNKCHSIGRHCSNNAQFTVHYVRIQHLSFRDLYIFKNNKNLSAEPAPQCVTVLFCSIMLLLCYANSKQHDFVRCSCEAERCSYTQHMPLFNVLLTKH